MRKSGIERLKRLGKLGHFQGKNPWQEYKAKIGSHSLGRKHSMDTINQIISNSPLSLSVVVTNKETNEIKEHISMRQTAKSLKTSRGTIRNYEKSGKLLRG